MDDPKRIYECLLDYCDSVSTISRLVVGQIWTVCQHEGSHFFSGLAMTPSSTSRTRPWPGTLANQPIKQIASWVNDWDSMKAAVGMAAINCSLNTSQLAPNGGLLSQPLSNANLSVFEFFLPQLFNQNVVIIGHYPGIDQYVTQYGWQVLERLPQGMDYPDPAAEFLLPEADWVFLSASTLVNKTFPRLASLAQSATTVLMGPTVPWLPEWHRFGIDYLAGVEVLDAHALFETACEGGGVRIFDSAVRYKVMAISPQASLDWLKHQIGEHAQRKAQHTEAMEAWYATGKQERFPAYAELDDINRQLSRMDSAFKSLWDAKSVMHE